MYKISIIIPVYQDNEALITLLHHLKLAEYPELIEIIVVQADMENIPDVHLAYNVKMLKSKKACRAIQLNIGADHATGTILYFVHADSLPPLSMVKDINDAVGYGHLMGGFRLKLIPNSFLLNLNSFLTRFNTKYSGGGDQTLFIRKDIFEEYGRYDEKFCIMEDFELVDRLRPEFGYHIIQKNVHVSSRKYTHNNYLRVNYANFQAFKMYRNKIAPEIIKEYYYSSLKRVK